MCIRPFFYILIFLSGVLAGRAQAQSLHGRVYDVHGEALPGATVQVEGRPGGLVADATGRFSLTLTSGSYTLLVSHIGHYPERLQIQVRDAELQPLHIRLRPRLVEQEEVVVLRDAVPNASLSVVTQRQIEGRRGQSIADLLADVPGVEALRTGPGIVKPVVRGMHSDRVVLSVAGLPLHSQQWGGEHAPEIDPFLPVRVEVIRGVAGVEYGTGAIGGVVRVEPRELPHEAGSRSEVGTIASSLNGLVGGYVQTERGFARFPGLGLRAHVSGRRAGDARAPHYTLTNTGFSEWSTMGAAGWHREQGGADVQVSHFQTTLGLFKGAHIGNVSDLERAIAAGRPFVSDPFSYQIDRPSQRVAHSVVHVRGHLDETFLGRLEMNYGFQRNHRQEYDAHRTSNRGLPAFDLTLHSHSLDFKGQRIPQTTRLQRFGAQGLFQQNLNARGAQLIPNFSAWSAGAFARETRSVGAWTLEAGLRYDHRWLIAYPWDRSTFSYRRETRQWGAWTGVVRASRSWRDVHTVHLQAGSAWRPPSVNELYSDGVHHGSAQYEVGDALMPLERSLGSEVSWSMRTSRGSFELSTYTLYFQRFVHLVPERTFVTTIRGAYPLFRYRGVRAQLQGIEYVVSVPLASGLELESAGHWMSGRDLDAGTSLWGLPPARITASLRASSRHWIVFPEPSLRLQTRFVDQKRGIPSDADFVSPPPAYQLWALEARIGSDAWSMHLSIDNLLNTRYRDYLNRYRYFADDLGRNLTLRITRNI